METIILKVGGSVCTSKEDNEFKINESAIRMIARKIKKAKQERDFRLILVNGAGPFGHRNVSEYDINNGLKNDREFEGFIKTVNDCNYLNCVFSKIFREEGLLTYPVTSSTVVIQDGKKITEFYTGIIEKISDINEDIIPVMNGTMTLDLSMKGSVVSGDAIIAYLAKKFGVKSVLFGTDVDGIYTADPKKDSGAKLIETINNSNFETVLESVEGSANVDVTQGMRGKLLKMREHLSGVDVVIFNANDEEAVTRVLNGEKIGTTIKV